MTVSQQSEIEVNNERRHNLELTDVVLQKHYKDAYLSYLKGPNNEGVTTNQRSNYQSILVAQNSSQMQNEEEGQKFDNMLQTKQDEIILESLKVRIRELLRLGQIII